jgi:hypothetical protein
MENNKLIAEFMGVKPLVLGGSIEYEMYGVLDCIEDFPNEKHFFVDDEMSFHTSWDWLMPVVDRIESLRNEDGNAYRFTIDMCNAKIDETNIDIIGGSYKLDSTYKAVVEFINKYS